MAYQSKYTGLQIDDILDSVEWKEGKIEDLEQIRAGAQKGATALQSYTEKYTGTVTGIKINGETKSGSGVIDLGTISTDISGKQDKLVDGVNIATINGQSLTEGGDLTIEGGAKVYTWNWDGSESGTLSHEEYDAINESDVVYVNIDGTPAEVLKRYGDADDIQLETLGLLNLTEYGAGAIIAQVWIVISSDQTYVVHQSTVRCPTKTSQLENDSNFVTSDGLKTINGESILGSGDITISGGSSNANVQAVDTGDVIDDVTVDYVTKAYVDSLAGDINSVLESIING